MTDQSEHRGWEINEDWDRHYLDDPNYDILPDKGSRGVFLGALAVFFILLFTLYFLSRWTEPPTITLGRIPPRIQDSNVVLGCTPFEDWAKKGYVFNCLEINATLRTVGPNYANPHCWGSNER